MYRYETHLHTLPVSGCARATVEDSLKAYSELGYDGVIITNHSVDVYVDISASPERIKKEYHARLDFYFSDYDKALELAPKYNIKVFMGLEMSYRGTDFLVYGLEKEWFYAHPEILKMEKSEQMTCFRKAGAFVVQAHPFREDSWIDHFRLYPRVVDGVEVINASRPDFENQMAQKYAEHYDLLQLAGSDMHTANRPPLKLAGIQTDEPINSIQDFISIVKEKKYKIFHAKNVKTREDLDK